MIRIIALLITCFFAVTSFAAPTSTCPQAVPISNPGFCASFKSVAECQCTSRGLPSFMCKDMNTVYNRMIAFYGTVEKACASQKDTSKQICMDDWHCYRQGGNDAQGRLCSSTGKACQ